MGLDIRATSWGGYQIAADRYGSYGRIHRLRVEVAKMFCGFVPSGDGRAVDELYEFLPALETFPALIHHSDSEGGYFMWERFPGLQSTEPMMYGDLGKLREELGIVGERRGEMQASIQECYDDLCAFVMDEEISIVFFQ